MGNWILSISLGDLVGESLMLTLGIPVNQSRNRCFYTCSQNPFNRISVSKPLSRTCLNNLSFIYVCHYTRKLHNEYRQLFQFLVHRQ
jgi:hypothetical protein